MSKYDREIQKIINGIMNDFYEDDLTTQSFAAAEKNRKRMLANSSGRIKTAETRGRR